MWRPNVSSFSHWQYWMYCCSKKDHDKFTNILSADNLTSWAKETKTCNQCGQLRLMTVHAMMKYCKWFSIRFMTPTHLLRNSSMITHCQQQSRNSSLCVRSCASGFLRCHHAILGDPFLILGEVRNESTPSLQEKCRRKAYEDSEIVRSCQPYVENPGFFPCRSPPSPWPCHVQDRTVGW